jgi:signal transduction histidine kinase/DNA-binding NarL/FixJ family response regulator
MRFARLLAGFAALVLFASATQANAAPPSAHAGALDLRSWDFARDGVVDLAGEWGFSWQRFDDPLAPGQATGTIRVPAPWNDAPAKSPGGDGYGTYRLRIECDDPSRLALVLPVQHSAVRIYANGRIVASQGVPGASAAEAKPAFIQQIAPLGESACPMNLVAHVSNYDMRNGGLWRSVELGTERQLTERRERGLARDVFALGGIVVLSLLPILVFLWRREDRAPLWLGLYGLSSAGFVGLGGERLFQPFIAPLGWQVSWKIAFVFLLGGTVAFPAFVRALYPNEFPRTPFRILMGLAAVIAILALLTSTHIYTQATPLLYAVSATLAALAVFAQVRAALRSREGAWLLLAGTAVLIVASVHDIIQVPYLIADKLSPYGLLAFALAPVILIARRFARALGAEELRAVEQQQRVDLLVNATKAGLLDTDMGTKRAAYSERLKEMLGYSLDADTSHWQPFFERTHPEDRARIRDSFLAQMRDLSVKSGVRRWTDSPDFRVRKADGSYIWIHGEAISITGTDGRTLRHICSFVDISERKRQELVLEESVRLREEVDRMGRHDLKTPLNSIIALPRLLREGGRLAKEDDELVAVIEQAGMRLLDLVNLTLDMFRMEQGNYPFSPQAVDLRDLADKVGRDLRAHSNSKRVAMRVEGPGVLAWGEELLCYSMLGNLAKNALEASPEGGEVRMTLTSQDGEVRIAIHNAGAVPETVREKFFEKYSTAGKSGGTGLGTYSARLMARTQGGDIELHTSEAEGTTLSVRLKAAPTGAAVARPGPRSERDKASGAQRPLPELSVLVVDDDEYNLIALRRYLPSPPLRVAVAVNGRAALESVMADLPDVVVMDLDMPVMGGLEAASRIRAWESAGGHGRTALIAMSAHDDPRIGTHCLEAGFDRFIAKPVTRDALRAALGAVAHPGPDQIVRMDSDLELALPGFLASRRALVEELALAIGEGRSEEARALAHKLAGGFALYGFSWASGHSRMIELRARDGALEGLMPEVVKLRRHLDHLRVEFRKRREEEIE